MHYQTWHDYCRQCTLQSHDLVTSLAIPTIPVPRSATGAAPALSGPRLGTRPPSVLWARASCQQRLEMVRNWLHVPEITETSLATLSHLELSTWSFPEVSNRAQINIYGTEHIPAVVEIFCSLDSILLFAELDIDVATQVVALVITNAHLFYFTVLFFTLKEDIFKEIFELLLDLMVTHITQVRSVSRFSRVLLTHVHVSHHNGLTVKEEIQINI